MHYGLKLALEIAQFLHEKLPVDNMVGVADKEKYIAYLPGRHLLLPNDCVGMLMPEGDGIRMAVESGKRFCGCVDKKVFGFPFMSHSMPVRDGSGNVIGGIGIAVAAEDHDTALSNKDKALQEVSELPYDLSSLEKYANFMITITHEIANKYFALSGLLEYGQIEEAKDFITKLKDSYLSELQNIEKHGGKRVEG